MASPPECPSPPDGPNADCPSPPDTVLARAVLAGCGIVIGDDDAAALGEILPRLRQRMSRLYEVDTGEIEPLANVTLGKVPS